MLPPGQENTTARLQEIVDAINGMRDAMGLLMTGIGASLILINDKLSVPTQTGSISIGQAISETNSRLQDLSTIIQLLDNIDLTTTITRTNTDFMRIRIGEMSTNLISLLELVQSLSTVTLPQGGTALSTQAIFDVVRSTLFFQEFPFMDILYNSLERINFAVRDARDRIGPDVEAGQAQRTVRSALMKLIECNCPVETEPDVTCIELYPELIPYDPATEVAKFRWVFTWNEDPLATFFIRSPTGPMRFWYKSNIVEIGELFSGEAYLFAALDFNGNLPTFEIYGERLSVGQNKGEMIIQYCFDVNFESGGGS